MRKTLGFVLFSFFSLNIVQAQVTIGCDEALVEGALLQVKNIAGITDSTANSTKGLLLPRVSLTAIDKLEPCTATDDLSKLSHVGLMVYNTTTDLTNTLQNGVYFWNGEEWFYYIYSNKYDD